jgi:hypothetical protein
MAQTEKSRPEPIVFDLNAAVTAAIGACGGDLVATVRSLVVANQFLLAQNEALSAELEEAWQLISPGFSRQKRTRRMRTGDPEE